MIHYIFDGKVMYCYFNSKPAFITIAPITYKIYARIIDLLCIVDPAIKQAPAIDIKNISLTCFLNIIYSKNNLKSPATHSGDCSERGFDRSKKTFLSGSNTSFPK